MTDAGTVRELVKRGVKVFSREGLHAKVIVAGDYVIAGSMNASANSRDRLLEAAIVSDDPAVMWSTEAWIEELCRKGQKIGLRVANELCDIYVEPRSIYRPPNQKIKALPGKRLATSSDWFYIWSHDANWSIRFTKLAKPILRRLRRQSKNPDIIVDALEYDRVPTRLGFGKGSNFFLGHFPSYARRPEVYRDCVALDVVENGIFYSYPANQRTAAWEPFYAALAQPRMNNGRSERRIHRGTANRILRAWGDLTEA